MRILGWFIAIVMILGMFKVIDVRICIAGKGQCELSKKTEDKK